MGSQGQRLCVLPPGGSYRRQQGFGIEEILSVKISKKCKSASGTDFDWCDAVQPAQGHQSTVDLKCHAVSRSGCMPKM